MSKEEKPKIEEKTKPLKRENSSSQQQTLDVFIKKKKKTEKTETETITKTKTIELDKKGSIISYSPCFLDKKESNKFFKHLLDTIPWTQSFIEMYGKDIKVPRLQCVMTNLDESKLSLYSTEKAIPWTKEVLEIKEKIEKELNKKFNYLLLN